MKGCEHRLTNLVDKSPVKTTLICGYFELSSGNSQPLIERMYLDKRSKKKKHC